MNMAKKAFNIKSRINFLCVILVAMFAVIGIRFGILQVIQSDYLTERAMNEAKDNIVRQSPRGKILDRNGRDLAISRIAKLLVVRPDRVGNEEQIQVLAAELSPIVGIKAEVIANNIREGGTYYAVKHGLESDEEEAINQLKKEKGVSELS